MTPSWRGARPRAHHVCRAGTLGRSPKQPEHRVARMCGQTESAELGSAESAARARHRFQQGSVLSRMSHTSRSVVVRAVLIQSKRSVRVAAPAMGRVSHGTGPGIAWRRAGYPGGGDSQRTPLRSSCTSSGTAAGRCRAPGWRPVDTSGSGSRRRAREGWRTQPAHRLSTYVHAVLCPSRRSLRERAPTRAPMPWGPPRPDPLVAFLT